MTISLHNDTIEFSFPEVHEDARCRIEFQRTLRLPNNDETYPLPAGLGNFPLRHLDDHASGLPAPVVRRGGLLMPMWQSEAMWISFSSFGRRVHDRYPFAVKIATGKINAVNGDEWQKPLQSLPQDYIVVPRQPWLDGYCVEKGKVRQFVAAPLGDGLTVEEQLTGHADNGGIQLLVCPMEREVYDRLFPTEPLLEMRSQVCMDVAEMGLGAGGLMHQDIYKDEYGIDVWDESAARRIFVTILNAEQWTHVTGELPAQEPITSEQYVGNGIPWFDWYDADAEVLGETGAFSTVKTIGSGSSHEIKKGHVATPVQSGPDKRPHSRTVREPAPDMSAELQSVISRIEEIEEKLKGLRGIVVDLIEKGTDDQIGASAPRTTSTRGPKSRLVVDLAGEQVSGDCAADVLARSVSRFGLGRVSRSGLKLGGQPLVSRDRPPEGRGCREIDGWFVMTHASNVEKKAILERLAEMYDVQADVSVLQPTEI